MDFELSDELKLLRETARRFTNEELIPHELEVDEHSRISEVASQMRSSRVWPPGCACARPPRARAG